jgi:anaerobic magnesium-protoporphyrin IX monomethyl ester cyclase
MDGHQCEHRPAERPDHPVKILLITAPWEQNPLVIPSHDNDSHYPIGLAYLHSYLESKGHIVTTGWLNNYLYNDYMDRLKELTSANQPDIVGFNLLTMNRVATYHGIELIHNTFPGIKIIVGGIHATVMFSQLIEKYSFIVVIRGEGEATFTDIANGTPISDIKGIAYSDGISTIVNPSRELLDLDTIPFPRHDLFFGNDRTLAGLITSRGCPNHCSFCCLNPISKSTVRFRSIKNVIEEIEYLIASFPKLTTIWIHDDSFFLRPDRVIEFCDEVISRGIKTEFICSARAKPLTKEMVAKLGKAGFSMVLIGMESGDPEVLKRCRKGITLQDVERAVTLFSGSAIDVMLFVIVGLPGETDATIRNTAKFIQKMQRIKYIFYHDIGVLAIYPGTKVYQIAKRCANISDEYWLTELATPLFTAEHSEKEMLDMKNRLMDSIAVERMTTIKGFLNQWFMIPYIIPWYLRRKGILKP